MWNRLGAIFLAGVLFVGCGEAPAIEATATAWPEADALFHAEPRWLGADDAYSVDLGGGRVLWLFGDSFIATSDAHVRSESRLVRNSVAIQNGYDPSEASIEFFWKGPEAEPASFFFEKDDTWYWPGDGERVGDKLYLFMMAVRAASGGLGFEVFDADVFVVENPDDAPTAWVMKELEMPSNDAGVIVGSASVLAHDGHLYAFGAQESEGHAIHLTRFPLPASGDVIDFTKPESLGLAFEDGQTELTVHHDRARDLWIEVQAEGFGASDLALRTANDLRGPFSDLETFYHPPESDREDTIVYAGKGHPELEGADLVVTYASNSLDFPTLLADTSLYFPRFVRVALRAP
ncbi:hypothetical protein [Polyangium sorediatum]|uniref:DUF4185 domain-containing protein n=1 Tax=Polyangium sorediatum TaxID=889274 RepID=A0ABT6P6T6_9BACT|nr:hypothetical protein [Polyangium sorediatum]MDI1436333.1 hypothetical protein [Polyangium sorediatum]